MHSADQFDFDFQNEQGRLNRELQDIWEANQKADVHNWTTEAMAMVWYLGINDWAWWNSLPLYTRSQVVNEYEFEQSEAAATGRRCIRTYKEMSARFHMSKEAMEAYRQQADNMAKQLEVDWSLNRPPTTYTYDPVIACMVSMRLGRQISAVEPAELDARGFVVPHERKARKIL